MPVSSVYRHSFVYSIHMFVYILFNTFHINDYVSLHIVLSISHHTLLIILSYHNIIISNNPATLYALSLSISPRLLPCHALLLAIPLPASLPWDSFWLTGLGVKPCIRYRYRRSCVCCGRRKSRVPPATDIVDIACQAQQRVEASMPAPPVVSRTPSFTSLQQQLVPESTRHAVEVVLSSTAQSPSRLLQFGRSVVGQKLKSQLSGLAVGRSKSTLRKLVIYFLIIWSCIEYK